MATNKTILKTYFEAGRRPKASEFAELIDSSLNIAEDKATVAEAEDSTIDNKYITPKTARKSVEKYAPVKKVNGKSPAASGEISLIITDIPGLDTAIGSKQATLNSGINIKTINGASILTGGNLELAPAAALDLKANLTVVAKTSSPTSLTTINRANVANLSFSAIATKKYKVEIFGSYQNNTPTAGGSLGFVISGGSGIITGVAEMQTTAAGSEKKLLSAISTDNSTANSFITSSQVVSADTAGFVSATLYFECITPGTFNVQWGTGIDTTSATLNNAIMIITPLN